MARDSANPSIENDDLDLAEVFLEHTDCGGVIDVERSDGGKLSVHCSGCGRSLEYALPGPETAEMAVIAAGSRSMKDSSEEGPGPTGPIAGIAQADADTAAGASRSEASEGAAAERPLPAHPDELSPEAVAAATVRAGLRAASEREAASPPRRSRLRLAAPALLGLGFLVAALLIANAISGDDDLSPTATDPPSPALVEGGADPTTPAGAGDDSVGGTDGGGKDAANDKSAAGQGKSEKGKSAKADGRGAGSRRQAVKDVRLQPTVLRGDVQIGLPAGWTQRGVTSSGAIQFGPPDNSVAVQIFYERGVSQSSKQFASSARKFVGGRRAGARPQRPRFDGKEARIRSPYGSGVELIRTAISSGLQIMAIATIPGAAQRSRGIEAEAVIDSASAA